MTSKYGGLDGSEFNKGADHIDGIINIHALLSAIDGIKSAGEISLVNAENKIVDILENVNKLYSAKGTFEAAWEGAVENAKKENSYEPNSTICIGCNEPMRQSHYGIDRLLIDKNGKVKDTLKENRKSGKIDTIPVKKQ
jgi:hypothetical protein